MVTSGIRTRASAVLALHESSALAPQEMLTPRSRPLWFLTVLWPHSGKGTSWRPVVADVGVLIIADDPLARTGVATLLADQPGYLVVGQASADTNLAELLETYQPDIAVWDLGWEPKPSLDGVAELRNAGLSIVALVPDEASAAGALNAGAHGLLLREAESESLLAALHAVKQGLLVVDPTLGTIRPLVSEPGTASLLEELTPRELEVLHLLAEGLTNKAIAERLKISEHTAKFHVNAILGKLDAQTRTEAVARAARLGLILL